LFNQLEDLDVQHFSNHLLPPQLLLQHVGVLQLKGLVSSIEVKLVA
jgi:hypothetical protein